MKSIRRTLILNVTLLLVLAFGAVAALVYRITQDAIQEKQEAVRKLVEMQFAEQRDAAMLAQARAIASDAQSQFDPVKFQQYLEAAPLGVYMLSFGPNGHITAPLLMAERLRGSLSYRLNVLLATDLKLIDSDALTHGFVQVNSDWGNIWRSKSLSGPALPLDLTQFNSEHRFQELFDDIELSPGVTARRVRMKAPLIRSRVQTLSAETSPERASLGIASALRRDPFRPDRVTGPPWYSEPRGMRPRPPAGGRPPGQSSAGNYQPTLYIQVAWTVNDPLLHDFETLRDQRLSDLDAENQKALANLKQRLTWIGAATLGIVVVGGWLLVGAGLAPLKRLSLAVSQVSTKDFKLPIEPSQLPREVSPVAERLQQTLQQLLEAFAREKRSSADISHELRTPLAALATTLDVSLRKQRSAEDYRQTIQDARQISRQISLLVDRMLKLAWLDAGADQVRPESVDIHQLVDGCAAIGKPLAEAQGLTFQVDAPGPLCVRTDPDKVREVVMNLMHNAIEYNRPGGEVELRAHAEAGGVVLEVLDTGIGIAPEMQGKIFERFYRGDPSRNAAGAHAGLGLAIVKEYIDRLGGRLSIESQVGAGSRFRVELRDV
jgi:two-component system, OmpR family, heavy metal sensor histidine kinase CusS